MDISDHLLESIFEVMAKLNVESIVEDGRLEGLRKA